MSKSIVNLLPPLSVAAVVAFWSLAPAALLAKPWLLIVTSALITAFVQALEWLAERHSGWRIDRREFLTDLFYVVLASTAIAWATTTLAEEPLHAAKEALGLATPWAMRLPFLAQVALVVVLIEFGQYWMHRLMHNAAPFWLVHAPHHHITQLNAMKGYVGNPIELFLISLSVVALFDLPTIAVFCGLNVLTVVSTFAHANVRADPPAWYGYVFTTIRHHSLHHSTAYDDTRCNYGNSLILLDRIFGTFRDGESAVVGQDDRRRLSIPEQFLFPAQPILARVRARRGAAVAPSHDAVAG